MKAIVSLFFILVCFMAEGQNNLSTTLNFSKTKGVEKHEKAELGVQLPAEIENEINSFLGDSRICLLYTSDAADE